MKILGLGNALVDILITLPDDTFLDENALPKGSMQLIDGMTAERLLGLTALMPRELASGGSASNTIHGLANLGVETAYIGKTGDDEHGVFFRTDMECAGIRPCLLRGMQGTGTAITFITPDSERTFGTYLGAAVELNAEEITPADFEGYDLLHLEGYLVVNRTLIQRAVKLARAAGLRISLDLASYNVVEANRAFLQKIIPDYVDILFANEEEARAFTGQAPREALDIIARQVEIAVVKVGPEGSWVKGGNQVCKAEAAPATLKDTTGAGDLYASGFLYGLSARQPLQRCAQLGSITAGKVIEVLGAKIDHDGWIRIRKEIGCELQERVEKRG